MVARQREVRVSGGSVRAVRIGSGPPIVCLQGGPGGDHRYLMPALAPLADAFSVVFLDQYGWSRALGGPPTLDDLACDIDAVCDELDLGSIGLIGHSWGAVLALVYAAHRRRPVRAAVLANVLRPADWSESMFDYVTRRLAIERVARHVSGLERSWASLPAEERERLRSHAIRTVPLLHHVERWQEMAPFEADPDWQAELWEAAAGVLRAAEPLRSPVLLLQGADDAVSPDGIVSQLGSPSWHARVLPECGHVSPVDCPAALRGLTREFFDRWMS